MAESGWRPPVWSLTAAAAIVLPETMAMTVPGPCLLTIRWTCSLRMSAGDPSCPGSTPPNPPRTAGRLCQLVIETLHENSLERENADGSDDNGCRRKEPNDRENESRAQCPRGSPAHPVALIMYPTPRTVWIIAGASTSIFFRR